MLNAETVKDFIARLAALRSKDEEMAHVEADKILCEALTLLGHDGIVAAWQDIPKWYA